MKDTNSSLVVLGSLPSDAMAAVGEAAAELDAPLRMVARGTELRGALAKTGARVVVIDGNAETAREACDALRGEDATERVALLAMTRARSDVAFLEMYQWGVDDLVDVDARALARRLRVVEAAGRQAAVSERPYVVVAAPGARWRTLAARSLANAGIDARIAETTDEVILRSAGAAFVLAADDLEPSGAVAALAAARLRGSNVPWVIAASTRRFAEVEAAVRGMRGAACIDANTPPDNVVFVGNELAASSPTEMRTNPRMMFGTTVAFRAAGRETDEIGFLYNISLGGMYVRTLAPLAAGDEVWLELRPPRSERRVRLIGQVAWRRSFGRVDTATAPPGFGVRITGGIGGDLHRFEQSVEALRASTAKVSDAARSERAPLVSTIPSILSSAIV